MFLCNITRFFSFSYFTLSDRLLAVEKLQSAYLELNDEINVLCMGVEKVKVMCQMEIRSEKTQEARYNESLTCNLSTWY